jgi:senataxin
LFFPQIEVKELLFSTNIINYHSQISEKAGFGRSLFERLVLLGHQKCLLNVQYRMHPSISLFPNKEFYNNQILDSPIVKERSYEKCFLQGNMYGAYSILNVAYGQDEFDDGHSRKNMVEVAVVAKMVANLFKGAFVVIKLFNCSLKKKSLP